MKASAETKSWRSACASVVVAVVLSFAQAKAEVIPVSRGNLLSGQAIALPKDLNSHFTVLILGFSQKSSKSSAEWGKRLADTVGPDGQIRWLAVPVLAGIPSFVRGVVVRSMKKEVPSPLRASFFPLFEAEAEWKAVVSFQAPDEAYVVLVNRQGKVLWKTHGAVSEERLKELQHVISAG